VVCITRVTGAGGEEIGRLVADKLGVGYVDDEIVAQAAAKGGVSAADVADVERRTSAINRLLLEIGRGLGAETAAVMGAVPGQGEGTPEYLRRLVQDVVEETAARGDVVIGAHGASFALSARPDVLRVHVTASPEVRLQRLCESTGLDAKKAARSIKEEDAGRADYLRRFYDIEVERPTQYDLILNTDRLTVEQAAELIARAAG